ncbi:MAG: hypothetical protein NZ528_17035 [Caldilineales bacterium]|nr:hypothetical protein [Caldilineales bacterium]
MPHENDERLQRLARLLAESDLPADDPWRRLAEALAPDDAYSHEQAEEELPAYVADELLGRPLAQRYPSLHRHLLHCRQCAELHAALLADLAEEPPDVPVPPPDLSFLSGVYRRRLRRAALQLAEAIVEALQPALRSSLAGLAEVLFDELEALGSALWAAPAASGGFALAGGELSDEARWLAAAWATTAQLGEGRTAQEVADLQRTGAWTVLAQETAARVAANLDFPPRQAAQFAQEYARLVAGDPSAVPLRILPRSEA